MNLNCENCSVGVKDVKCVLYEETEFTYYAIINIRPPIKKTEIARWTMPGVIPNSKIVYVQTLQIPPEKRRLESVSGVNVKRKYYMEIIPRFHMMLGAKKMKLTYILNMSSLTYHAHVAAATMPLPGTLPQEKAVEGEVDGGQQYVKGKAMEGMGMDGYSS